MLKTKEDEFLDQCFAYLIDLKGEEDFIDFAKNTLGMTDEELKYYCDIDVVELEEKYIPAKPPTSGKFRTYASLWEEMMFRLDSGGVQKGRPLQGPYSSVNDLGVDFSRLDDDDNGYYGITIDAVEKKELFFALQLCKEYKLTAIPWHKKVHMKQMVLGFMHYRNLQACIHRSNLNYIFL